MGDRGQTSWKVYGGSFIQGGDYWSDHAKGGGRRFTNNFQ